MSQEWREHTFSQALDRGRNAHGSRLAIVAGTHRLTFSELADRAESLARGLIESGVRHGDCVALWSSDCLEWLLARWAVPAIGAVLVPINTRFRDEEIRYILGQSDAKALIMSRGIPSVNYYDILSRIDPGVAAYTQGGWSSDVFPALKLVIGIGDSMPASVTPFTDAETQGRELRARDDVYQSFADKCAPTDVAQLMYTSGTTSFPKGAMVCHGPLLQNNFNTIARMRLDHTDRYLASVPLFSATGTSFTLSPFLAGAAIVLMEEGFSAERFCQLVEAEKVTMSFYVEPIVRDLRSFAGLSTYDLSSLRTGTGAPLRAESFRWLCEDLGAKHLTNVYGLSETSNAVCRSFWSDPIEDRIACCGRPMLDVKIRIADPDTDDDLGCGPMGEIQVNAYTVSPGYYKMPEETAASRSADGWLKTGDLGVLREDGQLLFKGRIKEMIKPGGFNVATLEVEDFIKRMPGIKEVALVGVPDERMGEIGYVYIETEDQADVRCEDVIAFCKSQIASYKVPRYVSFIKDWPTTGSGKIRKLDLRDRAIESISRQQDEAVVG
ncbi:MAG: AMP-binding protein [Rhodospirillales bacterium]